MFQAKDLEGSKGSKSRFQEVARFKSGFQVKDPGGSKVPSKGFKRF